jgi:protein-L-isoaspartate(D-aspartate) O-methyltransferase
MHVFLLLLVYAPAMASDRYAEARKGMVQAIEDDVRMTSSYIDRKELHPRIMSVMGSVERHKFVPRSYQSMAYANQPLPIGHGQTISQPYIVALMTGA